MSGWKNVPHPHHNTSGAKSAPTIKVTEPRAGQPGLKVAISKAAPATTQPCYKADLEGVTKKEVAGDQTNVQAKNKGPRCPPVDVLKDREGSVQGSQPRGLPPTLH